MDLCDRWSSSAPGGKRSSNSVLAASKADGRKIPLNAQVRSSSGLSRIQVCNRQDAHEQAHDPMAVIREPGITAKDGGYRQQTSRRSANSSYLDTLPRSSLCCVDNAPPRCSSISLAGWQSRMFIHYSVRPGLARCRQKCGDCALVGVQSTSLPTGQQVLC